MLNRYLRQIAIPGWGETGQEKLSRSTVLVIGAGGLGFPVLAYLCAAGVGKIIVYEFDTVNQTNLNRQLFFSEEDIEKLKINAVTRELKKINPNVSVIPVDKPFSGQSAEPYISDCGAVIDCSDNYDTRIAIARTAHQYGKIMVHGAVSGFMGSAAVFNSRNGPCYACAFPDKPEPMSNEVFGAMPGFIGSLQAIETIKLITGIGKMNYSELTMCDMECNEFSRIEISKKENCPICSLTHPIETDHS